MRLLAIESKEKRKGDPKGMGAVCYGRPSAHTTIFRVSVANKPKGDIERASAEEHDRLSNFQGVTVCDVDAICPPRPDTRHSNRRAQRFG